MLTQFGCLEQHNVVVYDLPLRLGLLTRENPKTKGDSQP